MRFAIQLVKRILSAFSHAVMLSTSALNNAVMLIAACIQAHSLRMRLMLVIQVYALDDRHRAFAATVASMTSIKRAADVC